MESNSNDFWILIKKQKEKCKLRDESFNRSFSGPWVSSVTETNGKL